MTTGFHFLCQTRFLSGSVGFQTNFTQFSIKRFFMYYEPLSSLDQMKFFCINCFCYYDTSLLSFCQVWGWFLHFPPLFAPKSLLFLSFFFIGPAVRVNRFSVFATSTIFIVLCSNNTFTFPYLRGLKSPALPIFNLHTYSEQNEKACQFFACFFLRYSTCVYTAYTEDN